MKRITFISTFISLVLLLTGCTVVKERYVRQVPRPMPMRTYKRPVVHPREYPIRHDKVPYRLRQRRDHYGH
jgi:hypothetical protein